MPAYLTDPADELHGTLSPIPARTPTAAVAAQLLTYFTSGGVEPGTRLPAERQLAQMLGTGRSAVREALAALEILGVVTVRPGSGTYLSGGVSELLPRTLSWGLMLGDRNTRDLIEIRTALEVLAAERAATRASEESLGALRAHLEQMSSRRRDFPEFVEADMHFHQEVAAMAGNEALSGMLQSVRSLLRIWVDRSVTREQEATDAIAEHERVLAALEAGDPSAAHEAMTDHMRTAGARVLGESGAGGH
ncbi:FadR/GntR family transcriptional regulator [Georgenia alba]|uniref:FadR/GntR family transcriptional regulator n=1 Tax=Georgenia alba TaxID=2233858 RepID=A0ABW2QBH8_9MICO